MRISLFLIFVCFLNFAYGRSVEHTVQRGETIESIASRYGVNPEVLLESNSLDRIYVGCTLAVDLPDNPVVSQDLALSMLSLEEETLAREAEMYFENGSYGKAVKSYNKLLKKYPRAAYYYNRGLAHYNNNKFRQASNDLSKALSMGDATEDMQENGPEILEDARKRHAAWSEEQGQLWAGAILGVAAAGLGTWAAIESSKTQKLASTPTTYSSYASSSGYSSTPVADAVENMDMSQVMNQLLVKTEMDVRNEELNFKNNYRMDCMRMGYTPSEDEVNKAYYSYLSAKYGQNTGSSSSSKSDAGNTKNVNDKITTSNLCMTCEGDGKCIGCHGSGYRTDNMFGTGVDYSKTCGVCNGKKICTPCKGTGRI